MWMVFPDFFSGVWLAGALWDGGSQMVFEDVSYKMDIDG